MDVEPADTQSSEYAQLLTEMQGARWKRYAPNPYRWYVRSRRLGFTLDVGCGIGRGLGYLGGNGVGVDHNPDSVRVCRERGFVAFEPDDFLASEYARPGRFDALMSAHVIEHLTPDDATEMMTTYLPYVRTGGQIVLITPQERGFATMPTHVTFTDAEALAMLCTEAGLLVRRRRSFPLPRGAGRWFTYNEFIVEATVPAGRAPRR
ncbi:MAG TPA: class I SAM-dependent methyltransferase [Acidimicrobiales bacterium]|nr:class I SAM-dependent methyltransferase [Acidimicrobiales bacterium]